MPTYEVTDAATGKKLRYTAESPATDAETEQLFSDYHPANKPEAIQSQSEPASAINPTDTSQFVPSLFSKTISSMVGALPFSDNEPTTNYDRAQGIEQGFANAGGTVDNVMTHLRERAGTITPADAQEALTLNKNLEAGDNSTLPRMAAGTALIAPLARALGAGGAALMKEPASIAVGNLAQSSPRLASYLANALEQLPGSAATGLAIGAATADSGPYMGLDIGETTAINMAAGPLLSGTAQSLSAGGKWAGKKLADYVSDSSAAQSAKEAIVNALKKAGVPLSAMLESAKTPGVTLSATSLAPKADLGALIGKAKSADPTAFVKMEGQNNNAIINQVRSGIDSPETIAALKGSAEQQIGAAKQIVLSDKTPVDITPVTDRIHHLITKTEHGHDPISLGYLTKVQNTLVNDFHPEERAAEAKQYIREMLSTKTMPQKAENVYKGVRSILVDIEKGVKTPRAAIAHIDKIDLAGMPGHVKEAVKYIKEIVKNNGADITPVTTTKEVMGAANYIQKMIDGSKPGSAEQGFLIGLKKEVDNSMSSLAPYKDYMATVRQANAPLNRNEAMQFLEDKLVDPINQRAIGRASEGIDINAPAFIAALKGIDEGTALQNISKYGGAETLLGRNAGLIEDAADDLARMRQGANVAHSGAEDATVAGGLDRLANAKWQTRVANRAAQALAGNSRVNTQLADILLNPAKMANFNPRTYPKTDALVKLLSNPLNAPLLTATSE